MTALKEPRLLGVTKTYETICPKCGAEKLMVTVTGTHDHPGETWWSVFCKVCGYRNGWTQWTSQ